MPQAREWVAPAAWRTVDFVSDLHLGEALPRTAAAFAEFLRGTPADAVVILGDLFEVWVGDDAIGSPFEAHSAALLHEATRLRPMFFMHGNRDFLVGDAWLAATGVRRLHDPTLLIAFGRRWLLTHGDALCLADADYQRFRAEVRGAAWQRDFLARPLAEREALARRMRDASEQRKRAAAAWADADRDELRRWMRAARADALVHGHTHAPCSEAVEGGGERHVLADWDLDDPRAPRAEVLRLSADAVVRLTPQQAARR